MNQPAQTTAAANALSGEKTFKNIAFAVTGNQIADCVVGIVSGGLGKSPF